MACKQQDNRDRSAAEGPGVLSLGVHTEAVVSARVSVMISLERLEPVVMVDSTLTILFDCRRRRMKLPTGCSRRRRQLPSELHKLVYAVPNAAHDVTLLNALVSRLHIVYDAYAAETEPAAAWHVESTDDGKFLYWAAPWLQASMADCGIVTSLRRRVIPGIMLDKSGTEDRAPSKPERELELIWERPDSLRTSKNRSYTEATDVIIAGQVPPQKAPPPKATCIHTHTRKHASTQPRTRTHAQEGREGVKRKGSGVRGSVPESGASIGANTLTPPPNRPPNSRVCCALCRGRIP